MLFFCSRINIARPAGVYRPMLYRSLSGFVKGPWKSMTANEKLVWEQLGWTERAWDHSDKHPPMMKWSQLDAAQKSAIVHGLKLDEGQWNHIIESNQLASSIAATDHSTSVAPIKPTTSATSVKSMAANVVWTAIKVAGPALNMIGKAHPAAKIASKVLQQVPTLVDEFADPVIIPHGGIETVVYLDDSGSMSHNLSMGKSALASMAPLMQGTSTRIIKFGSGKTVISPREQSWSTALTCLNWDAGSGSTYMWKMIEDDVLRRYRPGPGPGTGAPAGKLRLIVITDGFDTDSPGEYQGIRGMDPMMKTLLGKGYDVEFHIIVLGNHHDRASHSALNRYRYLAEATGGGYMALSSGFFMNEKDPSVKHFLGNLEASGDATKSQALRAKQKQSYLKDAKAGKKENFGWLKSLPP